MNDVLPHYVATRLGDRPDAYLVEGGRRIPLSLTEAPLTSASFPQIPAGLAKIDELASQIAMVERALGSVQGRLVVGNAPAMEPGREEALAQMLREQQRRRASAT